MDSANGGADNTDMNLETTKKVTFLAGLVYFRGLCSYVINFLFHYLTLKYHVWKLTMWSRSINIAIILYFFYFDF